MLKRYKEIGITNKSFFQGDDIVLSICKAKELNNPRLKSYIETGYEENDFEIIQKTINYTTVRFLKMEKNFTNTIDTLKRWLYVRDLVADYNNSFPDKQFNLKSFNRLKDDIIKELFK